MIVPGLDHLWSRLSGLSFVHLHLAATYVEGSLNFIFYIQLFFCQQI